MTFKAKPIGKVPTVDVRKVMRFEVAEEDRRPDCRQDPWECVFAHAMNRHPDISNAQWGASMVWFRYRGVVMRGQIPHNMRMMIRAYDNEGQMMPVGTRFEVHPPQRKTGTPKQTGPRDTRNQSGRKARLVSNPASRNIHVKPPHDNG